MRVLLALIFAVLSACAAVEDTDSHTQPDNFPSNQASLGQSCGGFTAGPALQCKGQDEYCHRTIGDYCGAADAPGVCKVKPQMCTQNYAPVCGCDGKTYPNECTANTNGVSASMAGECQ